MSTEETGTFNFTVDAKLLEELGERLVGKHFIALSELIKNGYDADAKKVTIEFSKKDGGSITVKDDGIGMTFDEFRDYWMRIGSRHKEEWKRSPIFKRPLTGSKGVGRLSAQILSDELEVVTVSYKNKKEMLSASITWSREIKKKELMEASVTYTLTKSSDQEFQPGTILRMTGLKQYWQADDFKQLARELWELVPPFKGMITEKGPFEIEFISELKYLEIQFKNQMDAFLRNYEWSITGNNDNGTVTAYIQHKDGFHEKFSYEIHKPKSGGLKNGTFEIRIYTLSGRQKDGLLVDDVREYLHHNGGVHIYDSGFHLPYYGGEQNDWIGILHEHARRINYSDLIPKEIQESVTNPMHFLPALQRVLGIVTINTNEEPLLDIAITRDKLVESRSFDELRYMIRYAFHYYALKECLRQMKESTKERDIDKGYPIELIDNVENILSKYDKEIKPKIKEEIKSEIKDSLKNIEESGMKIKKDVSFLGALATAGISSIGYQHELRKHMNTIDIILEEMDEIAGKNKNIEKDLLKIKDELKEWKLTAEGFNTIFQYYMETDVNFKRDRFNAKKIITDIKNQVERLGKKTIFDLKEIDENLKLPNASLIEWTSIFQNVLLNAFNAMEKSTNKEIKILSRSENENREILILDTGCGVDLSSSDELFLPFVRKIYIPPEKRGLGYGGTGLGLTIVKLIANNIGITVRFVKPFDKYKTAFSIRWREKYK